MVGDILKWNKCSLVQVSSKSFNNPLELNIFFHIIKLMMFIGDEEEPLTTHPGIKMLIWGFVVLQVLSLTILTDTHLQPPSKKIEKNIFDFLLKQTS